MLVTGLIAAAFIQVAPLCELSEEELAQSKTTSERRVYEGDRSAMYFTTPDGRPSGCGVWELTVTAEGIVSNVILLRHESGGEYEQSVGRLLRTQRFAPAAEEWTGLAPIMFLSVEDSGAD